MEASLLERLVCGEDLDADTASDAMRQMMTGEASAPQVAAFLVALRAKGETGTEVAAMASVMRELSLKVETPYPVVDTCGTGGDRSGSVNLSTLAALVVAGAGVKVAKHGNRAASSACGSADVLETLGVAIDLPPEGVAACIEEAGIGFCFAPRFHPAMRHVGPIRRELGIRTTFNILGPLTNPAGAKRQVIGVADPALAPAMADALVALDAERVWLVHGADGLDELTTAGPARIWRIEQGTVTEDSIDPVALGFPNAPTEALRGGDAATNAAAAKRVLDGEPGPIRDSVVLNAAAVLVVADAAADLPAGVLAASAAIDNRRALAALAQLIATSSRFSQG